MVENWQDVTRNSYNVSYLSVLSHPSPKCLLQGLKIGSGSDLAIVSDTDTVDLRDLVSVSLFAGEKKTDQKCPRCFTCNDYPR